MDPLEQRAILLAVSWLDAGIAFPHPRDGIVFHNREARLSARPPSFYRDYTVPTLGVTGRGPRRIIAAASGELYYTANHYGSFQQIR
jgi:ribonuclease T1